MAYDWVPDESLDAWKLNQMQIDPLLKAVNNSGVRGGVESSALNSDTIDKDIGTGAAKSVAEEITEHELGNIHYEYDNGNNRWAMRSGSPGVTGKVEGSTGELEWNCDDFTGKRVNWQKITTDKWGNVICSEQVIDGGTHSTKMWNPKTCDGGEIWRRMGTIEADCKYNLPAGKSALMTWKYKAVNENNAFILPVPRQDGWETPAVLNVCTDIDVAPRIPSSHWIQTAGPDTGASVPIQGVGEFGGIFAYQAQDYNGNNVGIGLASGIEFYDCDTINCRNTINPRPKSTTAKVDFGSCGKYGYIQISNVNPKHPWQFQLSGHFDPGSGGGGCDPGTNWWTKQITQNNYNNAYWYVMNQPGTTEKLADLMMCKIPCANAPLCGGSYYSRNIALPTHYPMCRGVMNGSVVRVNNASNLACENFNTKNYRYRAGEIVKGELGIATSQFRWTSEYEEERPNDGTIMWNPNAGLISGIHNDSPCRAYIDENGFVHLSDPEWMGKHGVKIPCANSQLLDAYGGYPQNVWPIYDKDYWCSKRCGIVNGEVVALQRLSTDGRTLVPQLYNCLLGSRAELGEIKCGSIGIATAYFQPYMVVNGADEFLTADMIASIEDGDGDDLGIDYKTAPGVIRGVMNDIMWEQMLYDENDERITEEEKPFKTVAKIRWIPEVLSYIDEKGFLHLPEFNFVSYPVNCCNEMINYFEAENLGPMGMGYAESVEPHD